MRDEDFVGFMLKDWYVFDNFAPFQIEWRDKLYPTAEHAYQAAHFFGTNPELAEKVRRCRSPHDAKELANDNSAQDEPDWKANRLSIMEEILRCKLGQHRYIRGVLAATGERPIVETNDDDEFWGWGKNHDGHNQLGRLWMKLRDER